MITGESTLCFGVCSGMVAVCHVRFLLSQRTYPVNPESFFDHVSGQETPNRYAACSVLGLFSLLCLEQACLPQRLPVAGSLFWDDKETVPLLFQLWPSYLKLCSSLLFGGVNNPASQHFSCDLKANTLPFSSAASLFKKPYQLPPFKTN